MPVHLKSGLQLQRAGRTGHWKIGYIHVLLGIDCEAQNWDKAVANYKKIQHFILSAQQLELYADVERLVSEGVEPECWQKVVTTEEHMPAE